MPRVAICARRLEVLEQAAAEIRAATSGEVIAIQADVREQEEVSRLVIPMMRAAGGGRIVNLSAVAGKQPPANSLPTSVSRAAGIALTKEI